MCLTQTLCYMNVEEEQKEYFLCYHSEKLAIAFGLMAHLPGHLFEFIRTFVFVVTATLPPSSFPRLLNEKLL
jgi:hypothetical protein